MKSGKGNRNAGRALASFFIIFTFFMLAVSGTLMHFADHSGVSVMKDLYMVLHNAMAAVFTIASIVHTINNRRAIAAYMRTRRREMGISFALTAMVLILAGMHVYIGH